MSPVTSDLDRRRRGPLCLDRLCWQVGGDQLLWSCDAADVAVTVRAASPSARASVGGRGDEPGDQEDRQHRRRGSRGCQPPADVALHGSSMPLGTSGAQPVCTAGSVGPCLTLLDSAVDITHARRCPARPLPRGPPVSLLVTGSIATDELMSFPGRFADSLVVDQLDKIALSFLVDDLEVRRGGCAANICFGLGNLGLRPVLVGAVGEDFVDYRSWLVRHNVDCTSVRVSETKHTARFVHTSDSTRAQIASFYAGAMSEAREIELAPIVDRVGGASYVLIGP